MNWSRGRLRALSGALLLVVAVALPAPADGRADTPVTLADPLVGTGAGRADRIPGDAAGATTPAAAAPFGMVEFGPDTVPAGVALGGGYAYGDRRIRGFSLLHVSGGGCAAFGTPSMLPVAGGVGATPAAAAFDHAHESASPGAYAVVLDPGTRSRVSVRLTATSRAGVARIRFPPRRSATVLLTGTTLRRRPGGGVSITSGAGTFCRRAVHANVNLRAAFRPAPRRLRVAGGRAIASFRPGAIVEVRLGVSLTDPAGAGRNLASEVAGASYARVRRTARRRWARALDAVRVRGGRRGDRVMFSTSLYHALLSPTAISDVDGRYRGPDGRVHRAVGWTRRSTIAGWDVYRTQFPLLAMLFSGVARDVVRSLLSAAHEGGCLPSWELAGQPLGLMTGSPATNLLAEASAFGVRGFDARAALRGMVRAATIPCRSADAVQRPGLADERTLGYVPLERSGGPAQHDRDPALPWGAVSTTLEDAVSDYAIGRPARAARDGCGVRPPGRRVASPPRSGDARAAPPPGLRRVPGRAAGPGVRRGLRRGQRRPVPVARAPGSRGAGARDGRASGGRAAARCVAAPARRRPRLAVRRPRQRAVVRDALGL